MMPAAGPHLRPIHLPSPAGWWPLAPGWWIVATVLLLMVAWLAWRMHRRRMPRRRWQEARRELQALEAKHAIDHDSAAFAAGVSQLMRRAARLRDPGSAGLRGLAWQAAVRDLAGRKEALAAELLALDEVIYRPTTTLDVSATARAARQWLRQVLWRRARHA